MNWHSVALPLIVVGVVGYHLSQKSIPQQANPFVALAAAYLIAFCVSIIALFATADVRKGMELLRNQNWLPVICLGLTAVAIELGFLYAYRTGWKISTTGITASSFTTGALVLIGVFGFKEELSLLQIIGIALCTIGIVCISVD